MEQLNFNKELSGKIALVTGGTKGAGMLSHFSLKSHNKSNLLFDGDCH